MNKKFLLFALAAGMLSCKQQPPSTTETNTSTSDSTATVAVDKTPFPDFGFMVANYNGPTFKLSQDYPETLPTPPEPDFFKIDYKKDWHKYLDAVKAYCFEGSSNVDFRVEDNKVRKWYHMPWQHYGVQGREGFHGLTQEAPVKAYQLSPTQSIGTAGAVAVGFYNDVAAYTIGEVWKNHSHPDSLHNAAFKNGAVLFKLLFVTLPKATISQQVPSLVNGIWWDAFVAPDFSHPTVRQQIQVALIQMDIMVRDDKAPSGWIFGNYMYNGELNKPNKWDNVIPVGVMWGDDPANNTNPTFNLPVTKTPINPQLKETIINPDKAELPATHLGWNGRLNGPVDNPKSSCYSCHSTAEYPQISPISPLFFPDSIRVKYPIGSPAWMRWFSNIKCGVPFDKEAKSMDFSLQMASSIQYFKDWKQAQGGLFASAYPNTQPHGPMKVMMAAPAPGSTPPPATASAPATTQAPTAKKAKVYKSAIPLN